MKISTKGRYALRMMIDLAEHQSGGYVTLKDIAERQSISKKYLEQIVALLGRSNLLRANRGYQGGYMLARPPDQCTVGEVLRLTEGGINCVCCLEDGPNQCPRSEFCKTLPIWQGLDKVMSEYLDSISLQQIVDGHRGAGADCYHI